MVTLITPTSSADIPSWEAEYERFEEMYSPSSCMQDEIDALRQALVARETALATGREEFRTPDGWLIRRGEGEISVMAPDATPGMVHVTPGKGRLQSQILYALAEALLNSPLPPPIQSDAEAFADRLDKIAGERDRITPGAIREAATLIRQLASQRHGTEFDPQEAIPAATVCADHKAGETGYCTFHRDVDFGTQLYALDRKPPSST